MFIVKKKKLIEDCPGGPVIKNLPPSVGDTSSIFSLGRFHVLRATKLMPRALALKQDKPLQ